MAQIALTCGFTATIDDADFESLSLSRWITVHGKSGMKYAGRFHEVKGRVYCTLMHRLIAAPNRGQQVDHINGDTLDNRRANLRVCSRSENLGNQMLSRASTSGFKGVHRSAGGKKWTARICKKGLGCFATPEDAAHAYDDAARQRWGEFARLNFPRPGERGCRKQEAAESGFLKHNPVSISGRENGTLAIKAGVNAEHMALSGHSEAQS